MATPLRSLARALVVAGSFLVGSAPPAAAAPPGAIPVFCTVTASYDVTVQVTVCRRATERVSYFAAVPAGSFLHATDVVATPNLATLTGAFRVTIGRYTAGSFPGSPSFRISGEASQVNSLHFTTPYIVLDEGESLAVYTGTESDFPVNLFISGYLASVVAP
jgi:hypothetical protein